jgi:hypothetical protein
VGSGNLSLQPIFFQQIFALGLNRRKNWGQGSQSQVCSSGLRALVATTGGMVARGLQTGLAGPCYSKSHCSMAGCLSCLGSALSFFRGQFPSSLVKMLSITPVLPGRISVLSNKLSRHF